MKSSLKRPSAPVSVLRRFVACLGLAGSSAIAQASLDVRITLVIGNSAYKENAALVNPRNGGVLGQGLTRGHAHINKKGDQR